MISLIREVAVIPVLAIIVIELLVVGVVIGGLLLGECASEGWVLHTMMTAPTRDEM